MPLTLNVGLSKKIGLPHYGSLGVSCNVQVELDQSLLLHDLDGFHQKVKQAYGACYQAVSDELYRQQHGDTESPASLPVPVSGTDNRNSNGNSTGNGTGHPANSGRASLMSQPRETARRATAAQVRALEAIAQRQEIDLAALLHPRFGTEQASELSLMQASKLIEELNSGRTPEDHR